MIRICIVCDEAIKGAAIPVPGAEYAPSGGRPDQYRHPQGPPDCVARPTGRGIAHRD